MGHRLSFVLFVVCCILFASCAANKNLKKAEKYLALGEYYDAASQYKQAYRKTSPKEREQRGKIALKMASCYAKINQTAASLAAYRNAIRYKQASIEDHLTFGRLLLKNGEYKAAVEEFKLALDSMPDNILAKNGLVSAQNAPEWKRIGSRYTVKKADVFNSRRADYCPMLLGDQSEYLYFTSTRNEAQGDELSGITGTKPGDLFFSQKDDKGKWSRPEVVTGGINTDFDEGAGCFTPDGKTLYLTQCQTDPSYPRYAQIIKSSRSDAAWGKGSDVKISNDTLSSYAHPAISPDGEWLYFCSARAVAPMPQEYKGAKYGLYRIAFHPEDMTFGDELECVYDAPLEDKSVSFPRISPDGRWLCFTRHGYGNFSIWHKDADLWLVDLQDGSVRELAGVNSEDVDSFHTWSSTGRWLVFSSRRDDGLYTKPYFTPVDAEGKATKPFLLPQENPLEFYKRRMESYNLPAFTTGPVETDAFDLVRTMRDDAGINVTVKQ